MTDIVERLRGLGCKRAGCDLLRYEAADQIERLRAKLENHRKRASDNWVGIDRLKAENAKLREALLTAQRMAWVRSPNTDDPIAQMGQIADFCYRAALQKDASRLGCHAGRDGECNWKHCPQERDGEPARTGRHCPLDTEEDEG